MGDFSRNDESIRKPQSCPTLSWLGSTAVGRKLVIYRSISSTAWRVVALGSRWQIWKSVCRIGKQRSVALSVCVRRFRSGPRPEETLIDCPGYTYRVMVTSVPYAAEVVSRMLIRPEFLRRLRTVSDGLPIAAQLEWSLTGQTPNYPNKIITPIPLLNSVPSQVSSP